MIVGERFAWGHIGKTGGDATLTLFRVFPELILHADERHGGFKHTAFREREELIDGKLLVLNIRHLPSWILSLAHSRVRQAARAGAAMPMWTADEMADMDDADRAIRKFTDNGRLTIGHWLRTEYLRWDFLCFIARFTDISDEQLDRVLNTGMINAATYDHEISHWFTPEQVERLYANNPLWAAVEARMYADSAMPTTGLVIERLHRRIEALLAERAAAHEAQRELAALRARVRAQDERLASLTQAVTQLAVELDDLRPRPRRMNRVRALIGRSYPERGD